MNSLKVVLKVVPASTSTSNSEDKEDSGPKYVDRAAARREQFGQPEHPVREGYKKAVQVERSVVAEQPNKNGIEESNVGSKMLEKMVSLMPLFLRFKILTITC